MYIINICDINSLRFKKKGTRKREGFLNLPKNGVVVHVFSDGKSLNMLIINTVIITTSINIDNFN